MDGCELRKWLIWLGTYLYLVFKFFGVLYIFKKKLEQLSINNYKLLYTPEIPVATLHSSSSWCYCMPLRQTHSATLFRLWIKSWRSNPPWETSRASLQYCHFTTSWLISPQIRLLTELIYTPAQPEHVLVFSSKTQLLSISKTPGCILKLLRKKTLDFSKKNKKSQKTCNFAVIHRMNSTWALKECSHQLTWRDGWESKPVSFRWVAVGVAEAHLPWVAQSRKAVEPVKSWGLLSWASPEIHIPYHMSIESRYF